MTPERQSAELEALRSKVAETEETLKAIGSGEVDALVVGDEVHVLKGSSHPYRIIREQLAPGAVVTNDGHLLYPNKSLLKLIDAEDGTNEPLVRFIAPEDEAAFREIGRASCRERV